jgi:hypothetical protein
MNRLNKTSNTGVDLECTNMKKSSAVHCMRPNTGFETDTSGKFSVQAPTTASAIEVRLSKGATGAS